MKEVIVIEGICMFFPPVAYGTGCSHNRVVTKVTFKEPLKGEELAHAKLVARTNFIELIWLADIMAKHDCSYRNAVRIFHGCFPE